MWKTSTAVGYGIATNGKKWIVVGRYKSAGNNLSYSFKEYVKPCKKYKRKCGKKLCAPDDDYDWGKC